jgi:hypothetical protein
MISKRVKVVAAVGLALGLAFGSVGVVSAQFGGGFGGRGGGPRVDLEVQISHVGTNTLIGVETPEKDGVKVYSIEDGSWSEYRAPKGIRVRPCGTGTYIGIMPEGPKITQLAAYSELTKAWVTLDLKESVEGKLWGPIITPFGPVYTAGRRVYAFSAVASKWGVLELPEGAEPHPMTTVRVATVTHGDRLYIFNPKFGRWDDSGDKPK